MEILKNIDIAIFYFINHTISNPLLDILMPVITNFGLLPYLVILTALFCINLRGKGIYPFLLTQVSIFLSRWICRFLKEFFNRPRPFVILENVRVIEIEYYTFSFPSGHTTVAFAFATVLAFKIPRYRIPVFIIAVLIGFSRIYVGAHYPSDVIAGMALGCGVSGVILFIEKKIKVSRDSRL